MKKFFLFVFMSCFILPGFAIDCQNGTDEKLIELDASKLDTKMYDKAVSADKIETWDYKFVTESYTGGHWCLQNEQDKNLNVNGFAICTDDGANIDVKNIKKGPYCWCKVESVDNYHVSSQWVSVKKYDASTFDGNRYENINMEKQKEKEAKEKNIQDCMDNCASFCQTRQSNLIHKIKGFYTCAKSKHKLQNVRCTVDNRFINAKAILVFDDVAEIQMLGGGSIVFKSVENSNDLTFMGEYEGAPLYLNIKIGNVYVGRRQYSMEECL